MSHSPWLLFFPFPLFFLLFFPPLPGGLALRSIQRMRNHNQKELSSNHQHKIRKLVKVIIRLVSLFSTAPWNCAPSQYRTRPSHRRCWWSTPPRRLPLPVALRISDGIRFSPAPDGAVPSAIGPVGKSTIPIAPCPSAIRAAPGGAGARRAWVG